MQQAVGAIVAGVVVVIWRLAVGGSILQGRASWLWSVWVETMALTAIAAGIIRIMAIRDGRSHEAFLGSNRYVVAAVAPIALLLNWGIHTTRPAPAIAGGLDARLDVLNKLADACRRTAKDEASCGECCEGGMVFNDTCECIVPWHCTEGDRSADACEVCCTKDGGKSTKFELVHKQGCVCNPDASLFE